MMNGTDQLAQRLRIERHRLQLSQGAMAERLGLPTVTYRSYESGRSVPPISLFAKLVSAGVDAHFVVQGSPVTELLVDRLDWGLLAEVAQLIGKWSEARPRPLGLDEQARFLLAGYRWAAQHGKESALTMLRALAEAA